MTSGRGIAIALRAAYLALHRRSEARFARHGVAADQFVLLASSVRGGHALAQRELGRRMSSDPRTVPAMLVRLERRGFVARETHPTVVRGRTASLTSDGTWMYRKLWATGEPVRRRLLGAPKAGGAAALVNLLTRVVDALEPGGAAGAETTHSHFPEEQP